MKELEFVLPAQLKNAKLVISPFATHKQNLSSVKGAFGLPIGTSLYIMDCDMNRVTSFDNVPHGTRLIVNLDSYAPQSGLKPSASIKQGAIRAERLDVPAQSTAAYRRAAVISARRADVGHDRNIIYVVKLLEDFNGAVEVLFNDLNALTHIFTVKKCMWRISENWAVDLQDIFPEEHINFRPNGDPRTWGNRLVALLSITSDCTPDSAFLVGKVLVHIAKKRIEDPLSNDTACTLLAEDVVETMRTIFEMCKKPIVNKRRHQYRQRRFKKKSDLDAAKRGIPTEDPDVAPLSKHIPSALSGLGDENSHTVSAQKRVKGSSKVKLTAGVGGLRHEFKLLVGRLTDDDGHTDEEAEGYNSFGRQGCIDIIEDNWEDTLCHLLHDEKRGIDMYPRMKATKEDEISNWQRRRLERSGQSAKDYLVALNNVPKNPLDLGISLLAHLALVSEFTACQGDAMLVLLNDAVKARQGSYRARKTGELLVEDVKRVIQDLLKAASG